MGDRGKLCNIKIITSNNRVEIYKYTNCSFKKGDKTRNEAGRNGDDSLNTEAKEENSERRRKTTLTDARNRIIRLIKCNTDMNTFITLTYAKDISYEVSKNHLRKFFRKLNDDYPKCKYLWVLELQKSGRVHYHILTNIDFGITHIEEKCKTEANKKIERDIASRYWKHGFVDIRNLGEEGNSDVAKYVATYIVKDLLEIEELKGQKIYSYSYRTMDIPTEHCYWTDLNLEEFLKLTLENYKLNFTNSYPVYDEGICNYFDLEEK